MNYKEAFSSFSNFGYKRVEKGSDPSKYADEVIKNQIQPLEKILEKDKFYHENVSTNDDIIGTNVSEYNRILDILNEKIDSKPITVDIGSQSDSNLKTVVWEDIDTSYQSIEMINPVTKDNSPVAIGDDVFNVSVTGKTIYVEKASGGNVGWNYDLKLNGLIKSSKNKKYFHHKDDFEYDEKRKTHREKYIQDTRELLLFNNHMFIAGSITTAIALILVYRVNS